MKITCAEEVKEKDRSYSSPEIEEEEIEERREHIISIHVERG